MKKVAIVTPDIMGPITNGGIGSAFYYLACTLASSCKVTILFAPEDPSAEVDLSRWVHFYKEKNIELRTLYPSRIELCGLRYSTRSYLVYLNLLESDFDIVHFADYHGLGYYSQLAARQGLAFHKTAFVVNLHGPTLWHREGSNSVLKDQREVELNFLERSSIALADYVISPSVYLAKWVANKKWREEDKIRVIPHAPVPQEFSKELYRSVDKKIMFAGRLEDRKGFREFVQALALLPDDLEVTILGKPGEVCGGNALSYLESQMPQIKQKLNVVSDKNHLETLELIRDRWPLVVMPSFLENSPCGVFESLAVGVPFIWADLGGTRELIHPEDLDLGLKTISAQSIAASILAYLRSADLASQRQSRPSLKLKKSASEWRTFHEKLSLNRKNSLSHRQGSPSVAVCIATKDRPEFLRDALESLAEQTYKDFEVVVVDDGSSLQNQKKYTELIKSFAEKLPITVFRVQKANPAEARNYAIENCKAEFFLFMDDDNIAKPNELERLITAVKNSDSDALTVVLDHFKEFIDGKPVTQFYWVPTGACLGLAPFYNVLGDTNMLARRKALLSVGGFAGDIRVGEDWDLLWRLAEAGFNIQVCPEALVSYRDHSENRTILEVQKRSQPLAEPTRNFIARLPEQISDFAMVSLSQKRSADYGHSLNLATRSRAIKDLVAFGDRIVASLKEATLAVFPNGIFVRTTGDDSQIIYKTNLAPTRNAEVVGSVYSEFAGSMQIYFQTTELQGFSEKNCVHKFLMRGWNSFRLALSPNTIAGDLRLDFGTTAGLYFVDSLLLLGNVENEEKTHFSHLQHDFDSGRIKALNANIQWLSASDLRFDNADVVAAAGALCEMRAKNSDPNIFVSTKEDQSTIVVNWFCEFIGPQDSAFEIFFAERGAPFMQKNSVCVPTQKGHNLICLSICLSTRTLDWRIDLGHNAGNYRIEKLGYSYGPLV